VVLGKRDRTPKPTELTQPEHVPSNSSEKIRIYNSRGEIRTSPLDKKMRIYVRARMYPGLSISRSLGDILAHHIGVTSEPNITVHKINSNEKFIAIATDGIWDILEADQVIEIISDFGPRDPGAGIEHIC